MSDETSSPLPAAAKHGFFAGLLGDIPAFVRGILATMFGTTLCFVAMLQLGGLQVPFTNYLTAQLQPQVKELNHSVEALKSVVARIEAVEQAQVATRQRLIKLEMDADELARRAGRVERHLGLNK